MARKLMSMLALLLTALLLLVAAGCGGGDSSSSDTDTNEASAIEESEDSAAGIDPTEMEDSEDESMSEDDDMSSDDMSTDDMSTETTGMDDEDMSTDDMTTDDMDFGAFSPNEDCQELGQVGAKMSEAFGGTPSSDTAAYAEFLDEFAERAPEEIRDDFAVIADAYTKMAEAFEGFDPNSGSVPPADVLARIQQLSQELDQAALARASTNISRWVAENCMGG